MNTWIQWILNGQIVERKRWTIHKWILYCFQMFNDTQLSEEGRAARRIQENYDNPNSTAARMRTFFVSLNYIGDVNIVS